MFYFATVYGAVIVLIGAIPIISCSKVLAPIIATLFATFTPALIPMSK